ncbi:tyrosine-protein phosphatase [Sabulicella rubraurantiaca]|uniref:tyrosine-protein phosphatase n=1 Tax=Sabulicella rubraurantiaca TaxID=2811429 RepID=UPI001A961D6A|nr:tyrosine-protein phosphatase [Sabulicella rubraurantiaca]
MPHWVNSLFVDHALLRIPWRNWGVVESGALYRSNHPLPWQLAEATKRHGLQSVINLRGRRDSCGSDALGRQRAAELGLVHADQPFESRGAPHKDRILRLMELYQTLPRPILIHCKSGADRTGLAAGIWHLMQGRTAADAARELSLRHGHVAAARTGILDAFFEEYAKAEARGVPFETWLTEEYDEAALRAAFRPRPVASWITDRVLRRE